MRTETNNRANPSASASDATGASWCATASDASASLLSALDATVTSEDVVVLGTGPAVPKDLIEVQDVGGIAYNPSTDETWSYTAAQRAALTARVAAGADNAQSKPIRGKVARRVIESLMGHGVKPLVKEGVNLSRVRTGVVILTEAVEGAEDCASNLERASSDEQVPSVRVPVGDGVTCALLVPTGRVSGPCIEKKAFLAMAKLYSATGEESIKMATFRGLFRGPNGRLAIRQYVSLDDALSALVGAGGVRTYSGDGGCVFVLPTADGNVIRALPENLREEARGLQTKFLRTYLDACTDAADTVYGGGKVATSVKAAEAVKTGYAYYAFLEKAGLSDLAEGAAIHGRLSALTSGFSPLKEG
jgi:hypothetical protein